MGAPASEGVRPPGRSVFPYKKSRQAYGLPGFLVVFYRSPASSEGTLLNNQLLAVLSASCFNFKAVNTSRQRTYI